MLKIKRVYDDISQQDGKRVLVDGVWPRGIKKEDLEHDEWMKDIAPSTDLRKCSITMRINGMNLRRDIKKN